MRWLHSTLLLSALVLTSCRGQVSEETPVVPIRNMYDMPRYDPQEESGFFQDGRTMRPQVEGTLAREMEPNAMFATGRTDDDAAWILEIPTPIVDRNGGATEFLERGHDRYDIYCAPCHSLVGDGNGLVAQRAESLGAAALKPPTFHEDRLRHIPDGQLYALITNGIRAMPAYRHSVPQDDRWAIVSYVRALQIAFAEGRTAMNTHPQPHSQSGVSQ